MEAVYYAARANLRRLLSLYPTWTRQQYAQAVGMSLGWVKKWSKRLREAGRIRRPLLHLEEPMERPAPMSQWQLDFKDASSVPAQPDGKQRHVVEVLNTVDVGTSVLVQAQVRADFNAESTLQEVASLLRTHGRPLQLTFDRDVRFVSSPHGSDFPSALVRFCHCLGIAVHVCDPHHPQQNGFVERYHRSYQEECLAREHPSTLEEVRSVTEQFMQHYNFERPHQGVSCGNRPPRTAFPRLPDLSAVPDVVNPDRCLKDYDVGQALAGQRVALHLSAKTRSWQVIVGTKLLKTIPLKGL